MNDVHDVGASICTAVTLSLICTYGVAFIWFRNHPVILRSSIPLMIVVLVGYAMMSIGAYLPDDTDVRRWFMSLSLHLIVTPILVKTWRLIVIFHSERLSIKGITHQNLFMGLSLDVGIQAILLCVDQWQQSSDDDLKTNQHSLALYSTITTISVLLVLLLIQVYRAFDLPEDWNETPQLFMFLMFTFVYFPVYFLVEWILQEQQRTLSLEWLHTYGIWIPIWITLNLLFIPKFWQIWRKNPNRVSFMIDSYGHGYGIGDYVGGKKKKMTTPAAAAAAAAAAKSIRTLGKKQFMYKLSNLAKIVTPNVGNLPGAVRYVFPPSKHRDVNSHSGNHSRLVVDESEKGIGATTGTTPGNPTVMATTATTAAMATSADLVVVVSKLPVAQEKTTLTRQVVSPVISPPSEHRSIHGARNNHDKNETSEVSPKSTDNPPHASSTTTIMIAPVTVAPISDTSIAITAVGASSVPTRTVNTNPFRTTVVAKP